MLGMKCWHRHPHSFMNDTTAPWLLQTTLQVSAPRKVWYPKGETQSVGYYEDWSRAVLSLTRVQALCDGGGIDEEAAAEGAADVRVELIERELRLRESKHIKSVTATSQQTHHVTWCSLCWMNKAWVMMCVGLWTHLVLWVAVWHVRWPVMTPASIQRSWHPQRLRTTSNKPVFILFKSLTGGQHGSLSCKGQL